MSHESESSQPEKSESSTTLLHTRPAATTAAAAAGNQTDTDWPTLQLNVLVLCVNWRTHSVSMSTVDGRSPFQYDVGSAVAVQACWGTVTPYKGNIISNYLLPVR